MWGTRHGVGTGVAEMMQKLLEDIQGGRATAASEFMYTETNRLLKDIPMLRV